MLDSLAPKRSALVRGRAALQRYPHRKLWEAPAQLVCRQRQVDAAEGGRRWVQPLLLLVTTAIAVVARCCIPLLARRSCKRVEPRLQRSLQR